MVVEAWRKNGAVWCAVVWCGEEQNRALSVASCFLRETRPSLPLHKHAFGRVPLALFLFLSLSRSLPLSVYRCLSLSQKNANVFSLSPWLSAYLKQTSQGGGTFSRLSVNNAPRTKASRLHRVRSRGVTIHRSTTHRSAKM